MEKRDSWAVGAALEVDRGAAVCVKDPDSSRSYSL